MKFTVTFIAFLSISSSLAIEVKDEDVKDKREAPVGYTTGLSSHSFQAPAIGHEGASAISVGAGYSVGGVKPYSFAGHGSGAPIQLSSEGLQSSGHQTIKLAPITIQPSQSYASGDLSELMSQLSHSINSGALNLQQAGGVESYASAAQSDYGGQEHALPQYNFGAHQLAQYAVSEQPSVPSYAAGSKGLGSYGSTGPVLFTPSEAQTNSAVLNYAPSSGHSLGDASGASHSFGSAPSSGHSFVGISLGNSGHSLGGLSLGGQQQALGGHSFGGHSLGGHSLGEHSLGGHSLGGHSLGGHSLGGHSLQGLSLQGHSLGGQSLGGHSLGGHSLEGHSLGGHSLGGNSFGGHSHGGHSLGGSSLGGHSLGGSGIYGGSFKSYTIPGKMTFKPSAFLGASVQSDSTHSLSGLHGAPSFNSLNSGSHGGLYQGSGGHGASFGGSFGGSSTKFHAPSYTPSKSEGYESVASFASNGHSPSHGASYAGPSSTFGHSTSSHAASSSSPQYYVPPSKHSSGSFGEGSSSFKAPVSSHSSLSSYSSGPKHGFHGRGSSRYSAPKDVQGSFSENTYNTIKYSEELKPRGH